MAGLGGPGSLSGGPDNQLHTALFGSWHLVQESRKLGGAWEARKAARPPPRNSCFVRAELSGVCPKPSGSRMGLRRSQGLDGTIGTEYLHPVQVVGTEERLELALLV